MWGTSNYVDLSSGRRRVQTSCGLVLFEETFDTEFSELIGSSDSQSPARWVRTSQRDLLPGYHCCVYGRVPTDIQALSFHWQMERVPAEDQRRLALYALRLFREYRWDDVEKLESAGPRESLAMMDSEGRSPK
jgi:hypothetical protein